MEFTLGSQSAVLGSGETMYIPRGQPFSIAFTSRYAKTCVFVNGEGILSLIAKTGTPTQLKINPEKANGWDPSHLQASGKELRCIINWVIRSGLSNHNAVGEIRGIHRLQHSSASGATSCPFSDMWRKTLRSFLPSRTPHSSFLADHANCSGPSHAGTASEKSSCRFGTQDGSKAQSLHRLLQAQYSRRSVQQL